MLLEILKPKGADMKGSCKSLANGINKKIKHIKKE